MAMVAMIILMVLNLTAGCVMSQSTVDDIESSSDEKPELQLALVQQQQQQMAKVLSGIVEKLDELQTMLTNRPELTTSPAKGGKTVLISRWLNSANSGKTWQRWLCSDSE